MVNKTNSHPLEVKGLAELAQDLPDDQWYSLITYFRRDGDGARAAFNREVRPVPQWVVDGAIDPVDARFVARREEPHALDKDAPGWIGVDLDGTWAEYGEWVKWDKIGRAIPAMTERVKKWLAEGRKVRVFTARVGGPFLNRCAVTGEKFCRADMVRVVQDFTEAEVGVRLPVTAEKDYMMLELWDDRCVQVVPNTGRTLAEEHEAELTALRGKQWEPDRA